MRSTSYYYVRNKPEDAHDEVVYLGGPVWGVGAHYLSETQLAELGVGKFQPELTRWGWALSKNSSRPSFVSMDPGVLTVTSLMFKQLFAEFEHEVVKYEIEIDDVSYTSFRPSMFIDLLDIERSDFRPTSSGRLGSPKNVVLSAAPEHENAIFGIEYKRTRYPRIIVSDKFKRVCDNNSLNGLAFQLCWPR